MSSSRKRKQPSTAAPRPNPHAPPGKDPFRCYCSACGGSEGEGRSRSYTAMQRHWNDDIEHDFALSRTRSIGSQAIAGPSARASSLSTATNQHHGEGLNSSFVRPSLDDDIEMGNSFELDDHHQGPTRQSTGGPGDGGRDEESNQEQDDGDPQPDLDSQSRRDQGSGADDNDGAPREQDVPELDSRFPFKDPRPVFEPVVEEIKIANQFIDLIKTATLDSEVEPLPPALLEAIHHPAEEEISVDDKDFRLSLDLYLSVQNASEETYKSVCKAVERAHPEDNLLSHYQIQRRIALLTGVIPIRRDMCVNSCVGFVGPYRSLDTCSYCGEARYDASAGVDAEGNRKGRKQFLTMPLAPQLQAGYRTTQGARMLRYRWLYTQRLVKELSENGGERIHFGDFFDGSEYLEEIKLGNIGEYDFVLIFSIDGAQLYRMKTSEFWIYIWIVLDRAPDVRYRKHFLIPGGIIPGPHNPKNLDSFIFPGLYHLSAIQIEGLVIWSVLDRSLHLSRPFLALATADGPAMATISGLVGHQGKIHCRLYCGIKGRHKRGASQYYPARLKPLNYDVTGCDHDNVDIHGLLRGFTPEETVQRYIRNLDYITRSPNPTEFKSRRLETGICKPSIFSGLVPGHSLPVPRLFPLDNMHLPTLNLPDLMINLWRGKFDCGQDDSRTRWPWAVLQDDKIWKEHSQAVADILPYIPGSFDRPPRNPALKISSGYKASEFLMYFYGFGPSLLFGVLPDAYWENYCKLAQGISIMLQEELSRDDLQVAYSALTEFSDEFEHLYYQRLPSRIHFVCPSIHAPSHFPGEVLRIGPGIVYSQWSIERMIGMLGQEVHQPSNAFSNIMERARRQCEINTLMQLIPDLEPDLDKVLPGGAYDLGDGYALLRKRDTTARPMRDCEIQPMWEYLTRHGVTTRWTHVIRWGRLRLPSGRNVRSRWVEPNNTRDLRCSRCVKCRINGEPRIAEVHWFILLPADNPEADSNSSNGSDSESESAPHYPAAAMISVYGLPHEEILRKSRGRYYTAEYLGDAALQVIDVKDILSVVIMAPDHRYKTKYKDGTEDNREALTERSGDKLLARMGVIDKE